MSQIDRMQRGGLRGVVDLCEEAASSSLAELASIEAQELEPTPSRFLAQIDRMQRGGLRGVVDGQ